MATDTDLGADMETLEKQSAFDEWWQRNENNWRAIADNSGEPQEHNLAKRAWNAALMCVIVNANSELEEPSE